MGESFDEEEDSAERRILHLEAERHYFCTPTSHIPSLQMLFCHEEIEERTNINTINEFIDSRWNWEFIIDARASALHLQSPL